MKTWVFIAVLFAIYMHGLVFADDSEKAEDYSDLMVEDGSEPTPFDNGEINADGMDYEEEDFENLHLRKPRAMGRRRRLYGGGGGRGSRRRGWWNK